MIALLQSLKEDLHQYLIAPSEPFRDPQWSLRHPACHSACLHVQIVPCREAFDIRCVFVAASSCRFAAPDPSA
jgi:hypothetical protein